MRKRGRRLLGRGGRPQHRLLRRHNQPIIERAEALWRRCLGAEQARVSVMGFVRQPRPWPAWAVLLFRWDGPADGLLAITHELEGEPALRMMPWRLRRVASLPWRGLSIYQRAGGL